MAALEQVVIVRVIDATGRVGGYILEREATMQDVKVGDVVHVQDVKVGDVVHVRGVVESVGEPFLRLALRYSVVAATRDDIVHVEPKPLQVGDKVRRTEISAYGVGRIHAIAGEWAMVFWAVEPICVRIDRLVHA